MDNKEQAGKIDSFLKEVREQAARINPSLQNTGMPFCGVDDEGRIIIGNKRPSTSEHFINKEE